MQRPLIAELVNQFFSGWAVRAGPEVVTSSIVLLVVERRCS
jgi:hypothetical protein